ncbi:MAG: CpsB/CapC family capsule biosynthesis tyrosine phosphatase, partial [Lachnospirales bacterium]
MIDFHSHIIPKIDDGSKSAEMSAEMLHLSYSQGVTD